MRFSLKVNSMIDQGAAFLKKRIIEVERSFNKGLSQEEYSDLRLKLQKLYNKTAAAETLGEIEDIHNILTDIMNEYF